MTLFFLDTDLHGLTLFFLATKAPSHEENSIRNTKSSAGHLAVETNSNADTYASDRRDGNTKFETRLPRRFAPRNDFLIDSSAVLGMTEYRGQKTEDRGQKTKDRRQKTEDRGRIASPWRRRLNNPAINCGSK